MLYTMHLQCILHASEHGKCFRVSRVGRQLSPSKRQHLAVEPACEQLPWLSMLQGAARDCTEAVAGRRLAKRAQDASTSSVIPDAPMPVRPSIAFSDVPL